MFFLIGIIVGVGCLSVQATLPPLILSIILLAASIFSLLFSFCSFLKISFPSGILAVRFISGVCLGLSLASLLCSQVLKDKLPRELENREIQLTGVITNLPDSTDKASHFEFSVDSASYQGIPVFLPNKIYLSLKKDIDSLRNPVEVGQRWRFAVRLKRPHGVLNPYGGDFERWSFERGIRASGVVLNKNGSYENTLLEEFVFSPMNCIHRIRSAIRDKIIRALHDSSVAGILVALVVGDQKAIDQDDWEMFNKAGISHLVAISGLHITLISGFFGWLIGFFWRRSFFLKINLPVLLPAQKVSIIAGVLFSLLYVLLSGCGIPAIRALMMILAIGYSLWRGKTMQPYKPLLFSAAVILLYEPLAVLKPGFWLSFSAVALILYVAGRNAGKSFAGFPFLQKCVWIFFDFCRVQLAITLGLCVMTLFFWGRVSIIGPVINAFAIPLFSFFVTPLALLGSVLPESIADWVLILDNVVLEKFCSLLAEAENISVPVFETAIPSIFLLILALLGTVWILSPKGWARRFIGVGCFLPVLFLGASHPSANHFNAIVFDVGQGGGTLIETEHHRLLFDTGPTMGNSDAGEKIILPYLRGRGIEQLDLIVVSHGDADHSGGLNSLVAEFPVNDVMSSMDSSSVQYPIVPCVAGKHWEWDGVLFEVLYPDEHDYFHINKTNALSCVIKVSDEQHSMLLTGDIDSDSEDKLVLRYGQKLSSDILIAPHHGSASSSSWPFLLNVRPAYTVFQVGYLNSYHHPHPQSIDRYELLDSKLFRSDFDGAVLVQSSASGLEIEGVRHKQPHFWYEE